MFLPAEQSISYAASWVRGSMCGKQKVIAPLSDDDL